LMMSLFCLTAIFHQGKIGSLRKQSDQRSLKAKDAIFAVEQWPGFWTVSLFYGDQSHGRKPSVLFGADNETLWPATHQSRE
jgi:hypothetical protein